MQEISVRLDKWLWAARFYKTRSLAQAAINGGKVHYDGQRVKPGKLVRVGAQIRLRQGFDDKEVLVEALSDKRRGASEAQQLYQETEASIQARQQAAELRRAQNAGQQVQDRRPDKKQRRQIIRFRNINDENAHEQ